MNARVVRARSHFEALAAGYDLACIRRKAYLDALDELILSHARSTGVTSHLDVGCGDGRLLRLLSTSGLLMNSRGIDVSEGMVNLCCARTLRAERSDFMQFQSSTRFDLLTMEFNVFGYLASQYSIASILRHARELLHIGGWLVFDVVNPMCATYARLRETIPEVLRRIARLWVCDGAIDVRYGAEGKEGLVEFKLAWRRRIQRDLLSAGFTPTVRGLLYAPREDGSWLPNELRSQFVFLCRAR